MKNLRNERGIALVTALLLTLISLAVIMALLYVITWQTQLSAAHKRYKTGLEAAHGGGPEIFARHVIPEVFKNVTGARLIAQFPGIAMVPSSGACLKAKLNSSRSGSGSTDYPLGWAAYCGADANLFDPTAKPDMQITLPGTQTNFNVYAKIVDTIPGNSDQSGYELLDSGAGVTGANPAVAPQHIPAMYRIEVQGQKGTNPEEKARLSILYAY